MPGVKQGRIKYHFLSLWYDSTWDWTQVSRAICEHSNHYVMSQLELFNHLLKNDIIIILLLGEFFTPALANGLSLGFALA